jgi:hypothetical protein
MWRALWAALGKELAFRAERRAALQRARLDVELSDLKARAAISVYKAKADIEWDMKWAEAPDKTWKDEFLLILWAIPLIGLFVPGLSPFIIQGFEYLKSFHPDAPMIFISGWAVIFAASFGLKQALKVMLPGRYADLAKTLGELPPDVPPEATLNAQESVNADIHDDPTNCKDST